MRVLIFCHWEFCYKWISFKGLHCSKFTSKPFYYETSGENVGSDPSLKIVTKLPKLNGTSEVGTFFSTIRFLYPSDSRRNSIDKLEEQCTLSPESTTNTRDSGIESIANRLSEDRNFGSSLSSSPEPPTTGNDQVDQSLMWHLSYCDRLVEVSHFGHIL